MPNLDRAIPRRFVLVNRIRHVVHERDGSCCMTVCGKLLLSGIHTTQLLGLATMKCHACVEQIRKVSGGVEVGARQRRRRARKQKAVQNSTFGSVSR